MASNGQYLPVAKAAVLHKLTCGDPHCDKPYHNRIPCAFAPDWLEEDRMGSTVNHPEHYGGENNPYEAIKVIEAWELDFCLGNVVKYISRAGKKKIANELEDLMKAKWYLERRIQQIEESANANS